MKGEAAKIALATVLYLFLPDTTLALFIIVVFYHLSLSLQQGSNFDDLTEQIKRLDKKLSQSPRPKREPIISKPDSGLSSKSSETEVSRRKTFTRQLSLVQIEVDGGEEGEDFENQENVFGSSPAPEFPFLVMDTSSYHQQEVYPNWRATIPIENDLFVGACVLKIKTDPQDEVYRPYFDGKRRLMELQLQGKFKQLPKGPLYMGIETPTPGLSMGFMTKSVANIILALLKKLVPDSHHSFGNKGECPHIVFPLTSSMDHFIVTPEGEEPPPLGVESFPLTNDKDDPNLRKLRIGPTYSLSFHSMYLDLAHWKVANLPGGLKAVGLSSFFGDRPLRMVAYDMGDETDSHKPHLTKNKRYFFCFEMSWAGGEVEWPSEETRPPPRRPAKAKKEAPEAKTIPSVKTTAKEPKGKEAVKKVSPRSSSPRNSAVSPKSSPRNSAVSPKSSPRNSEGAPKESLKEAPSKVVVSPKAGRQMEGLNVPFPLSASAPQPSPRVGSEIRNSAILSASAGAAPTSDLTEIIDLTIPAHVRYGSQIYFVFQFAVMKLEEGSEEGECRKFREIFSVLRTPEEIRSFVRLIKVRRIKVYNKNLKKRSNHTVNKKSMEVCCRLREALGLEPIPNKFLTPRGESSSEDDDSDRESEISEIKSPHSIMECFDIFMKESENDTCLLSPSPWMKQGFEGSRILDGGALGDDALGRSFSGVVLRATSETEWIVNWAIMSSQSLKFFDQSSKRTPKMAMLLNDIVAISITGKGEGAGDTSVPFAGYYFFQIETVLKVNYLCVRTQEECDQWVKLLRSNVESLREKINEPPMDGEELDTSGGAHMTKDGRPVSPSEIPSSNPSQPPSFLTEHQKHHELYAFPSAPSTSVSKLKKNRRSTRSPNLRKMFYRQVGKRKVMNGKRMSFADPAEEQLHSPLALSETLLSAVMALSPTSTTQQFAEFADTTNYLKTANIAPLSNLEKIGFFLNVFHTLLLHALLVLGPPSANVKKWKSFFHKISYECAGHILSLSEIEQNILRSKGAKPKLLWSFIPKWGRDDSRKDLAIAPFDPRVNILLNYGSTTCPPEIAKISPGTPSQIEQQLEEAVARNLDFQVRVDVKKKQISLPKMMYWYQNDYGSSVSTTVAWTFEHASPALKEQLLALDASGKFTKAGVVVKFRNYHYNFQHQFQKMDLGDGNDSDEVSDEDEEGDYGKDEEEERSIYQEL